MPALRQTSLIPGAWVNSDGEDSDKSGADYEDPAEASHGIHRHDSIQLQELLQPKRGSAVRAVQDPRYTRVVSLERRITNPDLTAEERPSWTKIGHHAILSSWPHRSEEESWTTLRMPSYDISGMHSRESSMTKWTNGAIDAVLRRSMDGAEEERPRIPSRPPPLPPAMQSLGDGRQSVLNGDNFGQGANCKQNGTLHAVKSKFVEHLQENAGILESRGVWRPRRKRSGWMHGLRGSKVRDK